MTAFGFTYDDDLLERLNGELWPGVHEAERLLEQRAGDEGRELVRLRRTLRDRYDELSLFRPKSD